MKTFDPGQWSDEPEDLEADAAPLTVEWEEPAVVAMLLSADGSPLLELFDRKPAGFALPSPHKAPGLSAL